MRLGLYGGSFDPIHNGHLLPVRRAMETAGLDRVIYLPTARPPHKREQRQASSWRRFAMVELALLDQPHMEVSSFEMESGDVAYTVDTLRHYRATESDAELFLLLGGDSFLGLPSWREWHLLPEMARLLVMARPGWLLAELPAELRALVDTGRALVVEKPVRIEVSSREIRRRIAAGERDLEDLLPKSVLNYLVKYNLYRSNPGKGGAEGPA